MDLRDHLIPILTAVRKGRLPPSTFHLLNQDIRLPKALSSQALNTARVRATTNLTFRYYSVKFYDKRG